jgi:hypothetical protein
LLGLDWQIQTIPAGFANPAGAENTREIGLKMHKQE